MGTEARLCERVPGPETAAGGQDARCPEVVGLARVHLQLSECRSAGRDIAGARPLPAVWVSGCAVVPTPVIFLLWWK